MKLFNAIAAAAVIGTSLIAVNPAHANQPGPCYDLGLAAKNKCLRDQKRASKAGDGGNNVVSRAATHYNYCPDGTRYHKIKTGGLLFKRTIAEGCYTDYQAAQLRMQANGIEQNRRANIMRNFNANRPRQCFGTANTFGYTTYGSATCY